MLHRTILSIISICSFKFTFVILFFPANKAYSGCALLYQVFHRHEINNLSFTGIKADLFSPVD